MPFAAHAFRSAGVGRRRRAHEDEVGTAVGQLVDGGHGGDAEHVAAREVRGEDARPRSRRRGCCAATRSRTCRDGSTRRPRPRPAGRTGRGTARRWAGSRPQLHEGVDGDGHAVADDERVEVHRRRCPGGRRPRRTGRRARRPDAPGRRPARPGTGPGGAWVPRSSIIPPASSRSIGTSRNTTSASASASTPPTPSITVIPNCGSRLSPAISSRVPRTIGATRRPTSPSLGTAAARSSAPAASHRGGRPQPEAHQAPLGLVGDGIAAQLHHDGEADLGRRPRPRRLAVATTRSSGTGTPWSASRRLDASSESVVGAGTAAKVPVSLVRARALGT